MQRNRFEESAVTVFSPVRPIFRAVVSTVVPEANKLDEQSWRELETLVEMSIRDRPPAMRGQLRLFLRMIQWLPMFRYGRSFTSLSAEQRVRVLCYLQDHRIELIRCGFWGVRTLAFLGYYGRRETLQAIGYAADPRGWGVPR
ncbi:MAG TPA: hypothetical protein VED66_05860 [Candidatus Sulfotelmatobacter sp.]|nr:hypothetical protein [Candidatus Sulfotelmatobacter sp.]